MLVIVLIPVAGKGSVANVLAIIGTETNSPHVFFQRELKERMIEAWRISSRYIRPKRSDKNLDFFEKEPFYDVSVF